MAAAAATAVSCILTRDRLFAQSAKKSLHIHQTISVVVWTFPQLRAAVFLEAFRQAWSAARIQPVEGQVQLWPG